MRLLATAAALSILAAGAVQAQDASAPAPVAPPKLFLDSGYGQHDVTPGMCKNVSAQITQCTIPAMTVGQYLVQVTGASTAQATDAAQQITVRAGDRVCRGSSQATANAPWAVGAARTYRFGCMITVVTDQPLTVLAVYADYHATKDPKGPTLSLRREPWNGAISADAVELPQQ
jgi:hypothetical protein